MRPANPDQARYFADYAEPLLRQGYSPLPVNGKRPTIKGWQNHCLNPPAQKIVKKWASQFPAHNIGVACGHLVALDIDDEVEDRALALQTRAFQKLSETPLIRIGRAPRRVLLYRAPEPFASIKEKEAQVLGLGTQVVLFGLHPTIERPYTWLGATPLDVPLNDLPPISEAGARDWLGRRSLKIRPIKAPHIEPETATLIAPAGQDGVQEGSRNVFIFAEGLEQAASAASLNDLLTRLLRINDALCRPPLAAEEIRRAAQSVWGYRQAGHLFQRGGEAHAVIDAAEFERLRDEPGAIVLLILLRLSHAARSEPFAIVKEAMSRAKLIANWSGKVYAHARDVLLDRGFLELRREGGGRGNPHLYALMKPSPIGAQYNPTLFSFSSVYVAHESNARVAYRQGLTVSSAATSSSVPSLFDADALPLLPTPQEQLRIAMRDFLADRPRGTHARLAGELGVSTRHLTNWKAGRTPLNRNAATKLRELMAMDDADPASEIAMVDRRPQRPQNSTVALPVNMMVAGTSALQLRRWRDALGHDVGGMPPQRPVFAWRRHGHDVQRFFAAATSDCGAVPADDCIRTRCLGGGYQSEWTEVPDHP
jgi:Bifunctional DNA primase/polymerase, N-terminal/Primase C terminal 1 (PriCT-1)